MFYLSMLNMNKTALTFNNNFILHSRLNSLLGHHQLPENLPAVLQGDDLLLHLLLPPLPHHHVDPQDVRGRLEDVGQTLTELLLTVPGPSPQVGEEEEDQPGLAVRLATVLAVLFLEAARLSYLS